MVTVKHSRRINQLVLIKISAHATLNLKILLTNYVHIADRIRTQCILTYIFASARRRQNLSHKSINSLASIANKLKIMLMSIIKKNNVNAKNATTAVIQKIRIFLIEKIASVITVSNKKITPRFMINSSAGVLSQISLSRFNSQILFATIAKKTKVKGVLKLSIALDQISLVIQARNQYLHVITVEIIKTKIGSKYNIANVKRRR